MAKGFRPAIVRRKIETANEKLAKQHEKLAAIGLDIQRLNQEYQAKSGELNSNVRKLQKQLDALDDDETVPDDLRSDIEEALANELAEAKQELEDYNESMQTKGAAKNEQRQRVVDAIEDLEAEVQLYERILGLVEPDDEEE